MSITLQQCNARFTQTEAVTRHVLFPPLPCDMREKPIGDKSSNVAVMLELQGGPCCDRGKAESRVRAGHGHWTPVSSLARCVPRCPVSARSRRSLSFHVADLGPCYICAGQTSGQEVSEKQSKTKKHLITVFLFQDNLQVELIPFLNLL